MAKWKPGPPKTDAVIRAGRDAKAYRVSLDVEKRFKRGMRLYAFLPLVLGVLAAYGVHQIFFSFILPPLTNWVRGFGNYPNFYLAAIYGFGLLVFFIGGQLMANRFGDKLVAGMTPLDQGLSLLQQRAAAVKGRGKRYIIGLTAIAGGAIYLAVTYNAKIWYLPMFVCAALIIERFVLPGRVSVPEVGGEQEN